MLPIRLVRGDPEGDTSSKSFDEKAPKLFELVVSM
jgi:hypothetical protein